MMTRVVSFTVPANTASWGLMERLAMRKLGEFDHPNLPEGHMLHWHIAYEITNSQRQPAPTRLTGF
jgi:RimJ/RimL family protein N-acetyltransferase